MLNINISLKREKIQKICFKKSLSLFLGRKGWSFIDGEFNWHFVFISVVETKSSCSSKDILSHNFSSVQCAPPSASVGQAREWFCHFDSVCPLFLPSCFPSALSTLVRISIQRGMLRYCIHFFLFYLCLYEFMLFGHMSYVVLWCCRNKKYYTNRVYANIVSVVVDRSDNSANDRMRYSRINLVSRPVQHQINFPFHPKSKLFDEFSLRRRKRTESQSIFLETSNYHNEWINALFVLPFDFSRCCDKKSCGNRNETPSDPVIIDR